MKRFVEGQDRGQSTLLPECLKDWIDQNNPVRVIDVFVDGLDLADLGFVVSDRYPYGGGPRGQVKYCGLAFLTLSSSHFDPRRNLLLLCGGAASLPYPWVAPMHKACASGA